MAQAPTTSLPLVPGAVRGPLPTPQAPQLCQLVTDSPVGGQWLSEIKFDGYRLIVSIDQGRVRLLTRNGLDWAPRLPHIAAAFAKLKVRTAMLDGELVSLREDGVSSFSDLQAALSIGADQKLNFYVFDLLHLDGWDLRPCRLVDRKDLLATLARWQSMLRFSDHFLGAAEKLYRQACSTNLEGIVCKKASAPYRSGRGSAWVKVKCGQREELIVVGWTPPAGSRIGLGALHLAYYDPDGLLQYAGGVGTGFSDRELARLRALLDALATPSAPAGMVYAGEPIDAAINWVRPELIAELKFAAWSGFGRVRHSVYLGLREDKKATQVVRPIADPQAARHAFIPRQAGAARVRRKKICGAAHRGDLIPPTRL